MIVVFLGPSMPLDEARGLLDAQYLPPAAQGDLYRACRQRPTAIGLIDGVFERVPSVWHKEVLWAMSQGIHVLGAASMGALRAAELHAFGMEGVGAIFEAFRDGALEADDEVAVAHATAEHGFAPASEALVNVRATLRRAEAEGLIDAAQHRGLLDAARALHYPRRVYPDILEAAGVDEDARAALQAGLLSVRVDQKREDAAALLRRLAALHAAPLPPKQVDFAFSHTEVWDQMSAAVGRERRGPAAGTASIELLLDEVRLLGADAVAAVCDGALARALALAVAPGGSRPDDQAVQQTIGRFLWERHARTHEDLARWLASQGLGSEAFVEMMEREAQLRWAAAVYELDWRRLVEDQLHAGGRYGNLSARARHKAATLAESGLEQPALELAGLDMEALLKWFFEERLGVRVPPDLAVAATWLRLESTNELTRLALREWFYLRLTRGGALSP